MNLLCEHRQAEVLISILGSSNNRVCWPNFKTMKFLEWKSLYYLIITSLFVASSRNKNVTCLMSYASCQVWTEQSLLYVFFLFGDMCDRERG